MAAERHGSSMANRKAVPRCVQTRQPIAQESQDQVPLPLCRRVATRLATLNLRKARPPSQDRETYLRTEQSHQPRTPRTVAQQRASTAWPPWYRLAAWPLYKKPWMQRKRAPAWLKGRVLVTMQVA